MHITEDSIIKFLRKQPNREVSTSELVNDIFRDDMKIINEKLAGDFIDKAEKRNLTQAKAKFHRNILYHLNKLVGDGLLNISRTGNRGEKFFQLGIEEDEEIILGKRHRRIIIARPNLPAMPIEGYERQGIIYKFDPESWVSRLNSLLFQSDKFSTLRELRNAMGSVLGDFNDVIGLNDFERCIQSSSLEEQREFISGVISDCEDFGRSVTLVIDVKNILNEKPVIEFITELALLKKSGMNIILDTSVTEFYKHPALFEKIISIYSRSGMSLYFKNKSLHRPPYMLGKAGPYTLNRQDFDYYTKKQDNKCLPVASTSIAIDIKKFFEIGKNINQFRKLVSNILKALFISSSSQRLRSEEYFSALIRLNRPHEKQLFKASRNYIRFWNYGWKQEGLDQNIVVDLIESTKKEVDEFCLSETSIFKACGMPTDFKTAFSCAYSEFSEGMSSEDFKRLEIKGMEDFFRDDIKEYLKAKEQISGIFDGGDRMRIVRSASAPAVDVLKEVDHILNIYKIPLFCYDFGTVRGADLKLTSFC